MKDSTSFNNEFTAILKDFRKESAEEVNRKQKWSQDIKNESFRYDMSDQKWFLIGAAVLVALSFLIGIINRLPFRDQLYTGISAVVLIGGFFMGGFLLGGIALLAVALVNVFTRYYERYTGILCLILAVILAGLFLKDYFDNKKSWTKRRTNRLSGVNKELTNADRELKLEYISRTVNLCEEYSISKEEYDKAIARLFKEFDSCASGEMKDAFYTDSAALHKRADHLFNAWQKREAGEIERKKALAARKAEIEAKPLQMFVEYTFYQADNGLKVTGKIIQGRVKTGDAVDVLGFGKDHRKIVVSGIRKNKFDIQEAAAGSTVDLFFSELKKDGIVAGQMVAAPDTVKAISEFDGLVDIVRTVSEGMRLSFRFEGIASAILGTIYITDGLSEIPAKYTGKIHVRLEAPAVILATRFTMSDRLYPCGSGRIL